MKITTKTALCVLSALVLTSPFTPAHGADDFKGETPPEEYTFGAMMGLGVIDSTAAFAVMGSVAKRILAKGFASDLNNQAFVEFEGGPEFTSGASPFAYSLHLRWDFPKDAAWTFYALGGTGGNITNSVLGNRWEIYPRFGVGAMLNLARPYLTLRGELSHELIAVGVSFGI